MKFGSTVNDNCDPDGTDTGINFDLGEVSHKDLMREVESRILEGYIDVDHLLNLQLLTTTRLQIVLQRLGI